MKKFLKILAVFLLVSIPSIILKAGFDYDLQVSALDVFPFFIAVPICAYLGLIPNVIVKKTIKDKKKKS